METIDIGNVVDSLVIRYKKMYKNFRTFQIRVHGNAGQIDSDVFRSKASSMTYLVRPSIHLFKC